MVADELHCLLVFGIFVTGMVEKRMDRLAGLVHSAIPTGNMTPGQATLLHFVFGPAQFLETVQILLFVTLAGLLKFVPGLAVRATVADFLCTIHREEPPLER